MEVYITENFVYKKINRRVVLWMQWQFFAFFQCFWFWGN